MVPLHSQNEKMTADQTHLQPSLSAQYVQSPTFASKHWVSDYRKLLLTLPEIAELDRKDAAELFD